MIRLRNPVRDDKPIHRLAVRYLLPHTRTFFPEADLSLRELKDRLNNGMTWVYIPKRGGEVKGFCHAFVRGSTLWIDMIALDRSVQGMRKGRALMLLAERYGRMHRCETSFLYVDEQNVRAQRFYRKMGYREKQYDARLHVYLYEKTLAAKRFRKRAPA